MVSKRLKVSQLRAVLECPYASAEISLWAAKSLLRHADNRLRKMLRTKGTKPMEEEIDDYGQSD